MDKKFRIEYLPIAQRDLSEVIDYIRKDNPSAANQFLDDVDNTVSKLEDFPMIGQVPKDKRLAFLGYRMLVIGSYLVFYVIKDDYVEIRRILHGKRKYLFLL